MSVFKDHIVKMSAYQPPLEGRNPKAYALMDFNERTVPVGSTIKDALIDYIQQDRLQMYPSYSNITELLGEYCGVKPDQVMITNGSDHGIDIIIRGTCTAGDEAIIPVPTFAMYKQVAQVEDLKVIEPVYRRESGYPVDDVIAAVTPATKLIVISNPNNPCGTLCSREDIVRVAKAAPHAAILVDECYFEYAGVSVCDLVEAYPNILITRTFSKTWGLPSLRFGYVIAAAKNILAMLNIRGPYDINQLGVVAARAALENPAYTRDYVDEVMTKAKPMLEAFLDTCGISYWPSHANYIWMFPDNPEALNQALIDAAILVRPKADMDGRLGLRITVGTLRQTEKLIAVLARQLGASGKAIS